MARLLSWAEKLNGLGELGGGQSGQQRASSGSGRLVSGGRRHAGAVDA